MNAASTLVRSVRRTTMRKVASYEGQVHGLKFNRYLLMTAFPGFADSTAVCKFGLHFMRARNNFGAAVFERGSVSRLASPSGAQSCRYGLGRRIEVSCKAIAISKFVVDLVLEEEHFLFSFR
jgi:hypothetical protein